MSTFGDQLFQFGGVPVASGIGGLILAASQDANVYWIHPANSSASDDNDGLTPETALKTLSRAQTMMTANQNDVAILLGNSSASSDNIISEATQLVWSKNLTHIIGTAYNRVGQRCSIRQTNSDIANFVSVTAAGCVFANFHVLSDDDTNEAEIAWTDSGQRNAYYNLHIYAGANLGASNPRDDGGTRDLKLVGNGGEHYFEACTIGGDTAERGAAVANIEFASLTTRNKFKDCDLILRSDADSPVFIYADSAGTFDRYVIMKGCTGTCWGTALVEAVNIHVSPGGWLILHDTQFVNALKMEAIASARVYVEAVDSASSTGRMVLNTG